MPDSFYPYAQPTPQQASQEPGVVLDELVCVQCGEAIEDGQDCINLFYGVAGRGPKSGQPMIVDAPDNGSFSADLHLWCVPEFVQMNVYEEEPRFCPVCEAQLTGG